METDFWIVYEMVFKCKKQTEKWRQCDEIKLNRLLVFIAHKFKVCDCARAFMIPELMACPKIYCR